MSGTDSKSAAQRQTRYVAAPNPPWVSLHQKLAGYLLGKNFLLSSLTGAVFHGSTRQPQPLHPVKRVQRTNGG